MSAWRKDIKCKCIFLFPLKNLACKGLTHGGLMRHKYIITLVQVMAYVPVWCQAITWTNDLLLIGHLVTNFSEIWIKINFFFKKVYLKMLTAKCEPFCSGLNGSTCIIWHHRKSLTIRYCRRLFLYYFMDKGKNIRKLQETLYQKCIKKKEIHHQLAHHFDRLVQDCDYTLEIHQSCTEPSTGSHDYISMA